MTRSLRQPPPHSRHGRGGCSLCAGPVVAPRRSWCGEDCVWMWTVASSPEAARRHLVGLHGHACWDCGADWEPGQQQPSRQLGYVYGGRPIREVARPGGRAGNPWDREPAPEGWTTPAWCEWPGPLHGPPDPCRVQLEVEHIRPLWSLTDPEREELRWWLPFNLQLLCVRCHRAKSKREAAERAALRRATVSA